MHVHPLRQPAGNAPAVPAVGTAAGPAATVSAAGRAAVPMAAQLAAMAGMLTGLWVAISPWFLTLQTSPGRNAAVNDLIIGLAVAGLCLLAIRGTRSLAGLETAALLGGVWLIISPFILDAKFPITASMYWSNIWSGAIVIVAALAVIGLGRSRAAS
ncbi:MAG: SPW repeat domain-containing protein [Streptosporangiaceae bacterium]